MTETADISPGLAAQAAEATEDAKTELAKPKTKTVMWHGTAWQIRATPGAQFLDAFERDHLMQAARTVLGEKQYQKLYDLDPDVEGDQGMDGFFKACNRAWGVESGN